MKKLKKVLAVIICAVMVMGAVPGISIGAEANSYAKEFFISERIGTLSVLQTLNASGFVTISAQLVDSTAYEAEIEDVSYSENGYYYVDVFIYPAENSSGEIEDDEYYYEYVSGKYPVKAINDGRVKTANLEQMSGVCGTGVEWLLETDGTLTISGMGGITSAPWEDYRSDITKIIIGDGITSICSSAFERCYNCTEVIMGDDVTSIDMEAFAGCSSAVKINLSKSLTYIGMAAFSGCTSLEELIIPDSVTEIADVWNSIWPSYQSGYGAFCGCESLKNVVIGSGLEYLPTYCFYGCSIENLTMPPTITQMGGTAFSAATVENVYISDLSAWMTLPFQMGYSAGYSINNNPLSSGANLYLNGELLTDLVIPAGYIDEYDEYKRFESIGNYVFNGCKSIKSVTIPSHIASIGAYAFSDCSNLTSVSLTDGLVSIGAHAFEYTQIEELTIPSTVTEIGEDAFYDCTGLMYLSLGSGLTSIAKYGFAYCDGLITLEVPKSITSIASSAFSSSGGNIPEVYYAGSESEWNSISFGSYNSALTDAEITFNSTVPKDEHIVISDVSDNISWTLSSKGTLTISGSGDMTAAPWRDYSYKIRQVVIEEGITSVANYAFLFQQGVYGISNLKSVSIPNSVTRIGNGAFYGSNELASVTIPESVTSIGEEAFYYCRGLTSITIPESVTSIGKYAFAYCDGLTSITIPESVTSIGNYAFEDCSGLTSITIPDSVTSIGQGVFDSCSGLTSVTIPDSVTSIGNYAFAYCDGLTSVTIPDSVTSMGFSVFKECSGLTSAGAIGSGCDIEFGWTTAIPDYAFCGADALTHIYFPDSITEIGRSAFYECESIGCVNISENVSSIGDYAFYNCDKLAEVTIPDSVTSIGREAFYGCGCLAEVNIGSGVTTMGTSVFAVCWLLKNAGPTGSGCDIEFGWTTVIPDNAFYKCSGLTSVTIPDSVTSIGNYAFEDCSGLTSVTIPDSVTSIGNYAFEDCSGLTSVTIPGSVTSIGESAFTDCSGLTSITIPGSVTSIGKWAFAYCYGLTSVVMANGVTSIGESAFEDCSGLTSVTIPGSVTSIGESAFYNCSGLTSAGAIGSGCNIEFGWTTAIPYGAFRSCNSLTSVTIPDSVTSIGEYAFSNCTGLTSVTIPESMTSIGEYAFSNCTGLTSVTIPESVTSIGGCVFYDCRGLTSVVIPESVTSIGYGAFLDCSGLTDVYYTGSAEEWNEVSIGSYNEYLTSAAIHYNYICPANEALAAIGKYEGAAEAEVIVTEDGSVTVNVTITDESVLSAENVKAYAAVYSGGAAESVCELSKTVTSDGAEFTGNVSGSYKIFIWDKNMCPITEDVG